MATHRLLDKIKTGDGRQLSVKAITELYRSVASIQIPLSGSIERISEKNDYQVTVNFQYRDVDHVKNKLSSRFCFFKSDPQNNISNVGPLTKGTYIDSLLDIRSDNGIYRARLSLDKADQQVLEIYKNDSHLKTLVISETNKHANICSDKVFGSMSWSKSGKQDKLVYVAQATKPKQTTFFGNNDSETIITESSNHCQSWGEQISEISHTCVCILDVGNDFALNCIDAIDRSLADPVFCDNDTKIACVAYLEKPKKYGLVFCNNRPSDFLIYSVQEGQYNLAYQTPLPNKSVHSIRVNEKGDKLIFLANEVFGAHYQPSEIYLVDFTNDSTPRRLFKDNYFNIVFGGGIQRNCFSSDGRYIYLVTSNSLTDQLICLDIEEERIESIPVPTSSIDILDLKYDHILIKGSNINTQPTILLSSLNKPLSWFFLNSGVYEEDIVVKTEEDILSSDGRYKLSAIYICPSVDNTKIKDLPTVVIIHGGPHANFKNTYYPDLLLYTRLGLRVLLINYRGSFGIDREHNDSLLGRIGIDDLDDCLRVIESMKSKYELNYDKMSIVGGSHGGFLACHLSCQNRIRFKSAVIRNPVVDLLSNFSTTDIPDWVLSEGLAIKPVSKYDNDIWHNDPKIIERLYQQSPLSKVRDANVPSLILLGNQDLRVPMSNGLRWFDELVLNGVEAKKKIYDDNHSLSKPKSHIDHSINGLIWILDHF